MWATAPTPTVLCCVARRLERTPEGSTAGSRAGLAKPARLLPSQPHHQYLNSIRTLQLRSGLSWAPSHTAAAAAGGGSGERRRQRQRSQTVCVESQAQQGEDPSEQHCWLGVVHVATRRTRGGRTASSVLGPAGASLPLHKRSARQLHATAPSLAAAAAIGLEAAGASGHRARARSARAATTQHTHDKKMEAPQVQIDTSMGSFAVELYYKHAPRAAKNFEELARRGYYDGVKFHRVVRDFVIQGGDPTGTGRGGESVYGGRFEDELHPELRHTGAGVLSMANSGPNTNGSQFFITLAPAPFLDGKHTVFGRVCSGMQVVKRLGNIQTDASDRPTTDVKIMRARPVD